MPAPPEITARGIAAGRALLGLGLLVDPERITGRWVGADGATPGGRTLARGLGARDLVLGLAGVLAPTGELLKLAIAAGVAADIGDVAAALIETDVPSSGRYGTLALAGGAAVGGAWAAASLD